MHYKGNGKSFSIYSSLDELCIKGLTLSSVKSLLEELSGGSFLVLDLYTPNWGQNQDVHAAAAILGKPECFQMKHFKQGHTSSQLTNANREQDGLSHPAEHLIWALFYQQHRPTPEESN